VAWSVSILPKAEQDFAALAKTPAQRKDLEDAVFDEFDGMKGDRVTKLFVQGTTTASIEKLAASSFPGSIRIQVRADYRATALCLPAFKQAFVTHVFHKSQDPDYKRAVATHDARASEFIDGFKGFLDRR
jgi:hypothetical protein